MAQDHNDIYSIVERLAILEGRITPANVKHGLNTQQKSVPQMPALFKPKTQKILGGNPNAKNPMSGYAVGGCEESEEFDEEPLEEAVANEDVLEKVKKSFNDYLKSVADEVKNDSDIKDKKIGDSDLKAKDRQDRDLIAKESVISADDADDEPWHGIKDPELLKDLIADAQVMDYDEFYDEYSSYFDDPEEFWDNYHNQDVVESAAIKTITNECGLWEVHGDEHTGFEIRHGNRRLPTRFKNLDEAEMALEMFNICRHRRDEAADYIDEA